MDLSAAEVGYFITQVALSGASFGVAASDLAAVGAALQSLFGYRCEPPMTIIPAQGAQLQSICIDSTCPLSPNATCSSYNAAIEPAAANSSNTFSSTSTAASGTHTSTATGTAATASAAGAATIGWSSIALFGSGIFAFLL